MDAHTLSYVSAYATLVLLLGAALVLIVAARRWGG
jgi:hypothetical protein